MAEDKSEEKPVEAGEEKVEAHPLDQARAEGFRTFPTWQTGSVDTSSGSGPVDIKSVTPVFEQTRQDLVRHAADVVDPNTDTADENVVLPDDKDEAEAAKGQLAEQAAKLPAPAQFGDGAPEAPAEENAAQEAPEGQDGAKEE